MFVQDLAFCVVYSKHAIHGHCYYHGWYYYYCSSRLGFLGQRLACKAFIEEPSHNQHLCKGGNGSRMGRGRSWLTSPHKGLSQSHRELWTTLALENCHSLGWEGSAFTPPQWWVITGGCPRRRQAFDKPEVFLSWGHLQRGLQAEGIF